MWKRNRDVTVHGKPRVVALAGGVGGAKLATGLQAALAPGALTAIVNTGDDFEHWGLTICPDLDTVVYNLAGINNPETGWGLDGETFVALETMSLLGRRGVVPSGRQGPRPASASHGVAAAEYLAD